jgi:hypothetical protein
MCTPDVVAQHTNWTYIAKNKEAEKILFARLRSRLHRMGAELGTGGPQCESNSLN